MLPRPSAHVSQIGATRGHPIHPWSFLPELHSPPAQTPSFEKLLVFGLGNPYLPRTRDPSFLAAHETQSPPCYEIAVSLSLAPHLAHYMYINLRFFSLVLVLPASICDPRPCPVLPQEATMRRRGVVCTPGSGSDRPIDSPPPNRDLTCLPASCNPAPAVSRKAADQGTRVRSPSASAETPVQFHPNENRLQTRNTPAESQLPGSPNSPCVSISCFSLPSSSLSQTLRTLPLEQTRHRPVSTSHYCWATW